MGIEVCNWILNWILELDIGLGYWILDIGNGYWNWKLEIYVNSTKADQISAVKYGIEDK